MQLFSSFFSTNLIPPTGCFEVIKFRRADYADKVLAQPVEEYILYGKNYTRVISRLDSFEFGKDPYGCGGSYSCDKYFECGKSPYVNLRNGYWLVRWPWYGLNYYGCSMLLDINWEDVSSHRQGWSSDDVTILDAHPIVEEYNFTMTAIDRIYGTNFLSMVKSGPCELIVDGVCRNDYKWWDGGIDCQLEDESIEIYTHLRDVINQYEGMVIYLFQSGKYEKYLEENKRDLQSVSVELP